MDTDIYTKMLMGQHAQKAAFNYIVQNSDIAANRAAIIGNTSFAKEMAFGAPDSFAHTLVLCDVIIRPRLVIASNHLIGCGATGLLTGAGLAGIDGWVDNGKVIYDAGG